MKFSASGLKTWQSCGLKAKYKYKDHIEVDKTIWAKTLFGTIVHAALEHYNLTLDLEASTAMFLDMWNNPEAHGLDTITTWGRGTTYGGLRKKGVQILKEYEEKNRWENREVIGVEHEFLVPIGDHWLQGYVDLIEVKKSNRGKEVLRVVDFKTSSKQPYVAELRMDIQFSVYSYASTTPEFWMGVDHPEYGMVGGFPNGEELYERFRDTERRAIWYHLWGNKEIDAGKRDDQDFLRLYRLISECAKAYEFDVFVPSISGESCGLCDYVDQCTAVGPILDRLVEIDLDEDEGAF